MTRWTTRPPTKPGYYWAVGTEASMLGDRPTVVEVTEDRGRFKAWLVGNEVERDLSSFAKWGRRPLRPPPKGDP